MKTPEGNKKKETVVIGPNFLAHWFVYDYELCADRSELERVMKYINHRGYYLISVTQDADGVCTVFFWRRERG